MPSAVIDAQIPTNTATIASPSVQTNKTRRASLRVLSRNIDQVVLGDLTFPTWYYSPYPDNVVLRVEEQQQQRVLDQAAGVPSVTSAPHSRHGEVDAPSRDHVSSSGAAYLNGERQRQTPSSSAAQTSTVRATATASCSRLHVCPYCFRYTPKAGEYVRHLRRHKVDYDPYSNSRRYEVQNGDEDEDEDKEGDTREGSEDASTWPVPDTAIKVYEWAGHTVWDVDGEREKLYCQNLSLFGKLFLEQKSVFFDTGGFHYFVLTYTPPPASDKSNMGRKNAATARGAGPGRQRASSNTVDTKSVNTPPDIKLRTQVQGFFSKENLSWDANNLACILVFPPYQHRNLGQLLMSVSYKLSGWEWEDSIIGGPEKPLSAMGQKSYLRFWSERVARFMMGQTADADGNRIFVNGRKRSKKTAFSKEELTIKEIGDRTGMLAEDVISALNEMGIIEQAPSKKKKKRKSDDDETVAEDQSMNTMLVQRSKVLEWARQRGVDLISPVTEEGFLGEWALSEVDDESVESDEASEGEEEESQND